MATAANIITSGRYDLRDTGSNLYADEELLDYLNRVRKLMYSALLAVHSDWVHATDSSVSLSSGASSATAPTTAASIRSVWYDDDQLVEKPVDYIYYKQKHIDSTGQPNYWAHEGSNIIFERTADAAYTLTAHYNTKGSDLASGDDMPFDDTFNEVIREGMVLMAKNRNEVPGSINAQLYNMFNNQAMADIISRKHCKKNYFLGF